MGWLLNSYRFGVAATTYLYRAIGASKTAEDGTANYTETDGSIAASAGAYSVTAQSTPTWADLGVVSSDVNAVAGKAFQFTLNGSAIATTQLIAGWTNNGLALANMMSGIHVDGAGNVDIYSNGASTFGNVSTVANSTDETFTVIKGGFDASGIPMDAAANIASYPYGASIFQQTTTGNHKLIARAPDILDTAQDFPALSFYDYGGTYDYTIVPDVDLSALLEPVVLDTFTDTNGVGLDAHTMDVGSGWTEHAGTWEIQSNQLTEQIGASAEYSASFDSGDADVIVEANVNIGSSSTSQMGLGLRVTDNNNLWQIRLIKAATGMRIYEKVAGTPTLRASGGNVVNSVDYKVTVIAEGQDITCFLDGGSKITYGSATFNETTTNHGVFSALSGAGSYIDNLAVYPRGTGGEYSDLDSY